MTFLWIAAGIVAFIVSLICFGKSGKRIDKVIGLLLAVLFGPFYWIYYMVVKKYCR
jgi:Mn2+/Fe2+ NRAMP family transporter